VSLVNSDLFVATLELNATQIDTLFGTPVEFVPAPGAGLLAIPVHVVARLTRGTTAWNNSRNLLIHYNGDTSNLVQLVSVPFAASNGSTLDQFLQAARTGSHTPSNNFNPSNRAIMAAIATGDIGGGSADTILRLSMLYEVIRSMY
jgi:hypothetical protein